MYNMKRTKEEAAITRATVLKAALTVFSKKGYAAARLDVAREPRRHRLREARGRHLGPAAGAGSRQNLPEVVRSHTPANPAR